MIYLRVPRPVCVFLVERITKHRDSCSSLCTGRLQLFCVSHWRYVWHECHPGVWELLHDLHTAPYTHAKTHNLYKTCSTPVASLLQQGCCEIYSHCLFPTCWEVATSLQQTCYKLDELNGLVTSCSNNLLLCCKSTSCESQNFVQTWQNNSIATTCWQASYKLVANTTCWQDARFLRCVVSDLALRQQYC